MKLWRTVDQDDVFQRHGLKKVIKRQIVGIVR